MNKTNQLDFTGTTIYCGVDVHKKNWRVNIQDKEFELEDFSQDADPVLLSKHLNRKYPGAKFKVCYEAGDVKKLNYVYRINRNKERLRA